MPVTLWLSLVACGPSAPGRDQPGNLEVDTIELVFAPLDIGTDPPASQEVWIRNAGAGVLSVMAPRIEGDDAFRASGDAIVLEPSDSYGFDVVFDPEAPFLHDAKLILESDADGSPGEVALHGEANAPVIEPEASSLAMGQPNLGCRVVESLRVQNAGNDTLVVAPSLVGSTELALVADGDSVEIAPGGAASIQVAYEPADDTMDAATLILDSSDPIRPITEIEVTGGGAFVSTRSEWFDGVVPTTDIVVVVDNSGSMLYEQSKLADTIDVFVGSLAASGVDYRIGVITSDTSSFAGDVVTNGTTDPGAVLADQIDELGTGGAGTTRSLEMLYDCVQPGSDCSEKAGFLRPDALLDAIVVADGPDLSTLTPEAYVEYLWTLKSDPDLIRFDVIAGAVPVPTCGTCSSAGFGYDEAVELTEGRYLDICGNWTNNLEVLGRSAFSPVSWRLELSETPLVDTIEVVVDGALIASGNWTYVVNAIEFDLAALPPPGARIEVRYAVAAVCD